MSIADVASKIDPNNNQIGTIPAKSYGADQQLSTLEHFEVIVRVIVMVVVLVSCYILHIRTHYLTLVNLTLTPIN